MFDVNELTLIINQNDKLDNDELLDYMLKNQIDLVISINQKLIKFDRFRKLKLISLEEKILSTENEFLRKQIKIELDLGQLFIDSNEEFSPVEHTFTYAHVDNLLLRLKPSSNSTVSEIEYSKETREFFIEILEKTFNDPRLLHERTVVICEDNKLASLMMMSIILMRQAQIEGTVNVNMTANTVLTKIPKILKKTSLPLLVPPYRQTFDLSRNEHETFFNSIFDMPEYELINQIAVDIARILDSNYKSKQKKIDSQKYMTQITSI